MKILSFAVIGFCAAILSGCVTTQTSVISPQQLLVAGNAFDALELSAVNYLNLPLCPTGKPVCRTTTVSKSLKKAVLSARSARSKLEAFVNANPGSPIPVSLYQTVETAVVTLQNLISQNGIQ